MKQYDLRGCFGIERETLRVDSAGRLAQTPHPFAYDPHITRDFCENQIELVTPVADSIDGALQHLADLDKQVRDVLSQNGETLWLYSNSPHFDSEDEIPIADFTGDHSSKRQYREILEQKYGKKLMLFSGIHFNFSFSEDYLHTLNTKNEDFRSFRDAFYLRLYKQLMRHSFLLVLLTAASPFFDASLDCGQCPPTFQFPSGEAEPFFYGNTAYITKKKKAQPVQKLNTHRYVHFSIAGRTESSRQGFPVSQIQIRQCEHDIQFGGLFSQTPISCFSISE